MREAQAHPFVASLLGMFVAVTAVSGGLAAIKVPGVASSPGFASEQVFSPTADDWEPTVAADPSSSWVYQAVTYINASRTCSGCPATAIFFRSSSDGGTTWGVAHPIFLGDGWQYDPQIKVARDGTVYVVFLVSYDPGSVLFKSTDRGQTWTGPVLLNTGLGYNDKPVLVISPSGKDVYVAYNVKLAGYVAVSHDYGDHFAAPVKAVSGWWYYADGGAIAPNGDVYFGEVGEAGNKTNGAGTTITNGGHLTGPETITIIRSADGGVSWPTVFTDESHGPPPCGAICKYYPDRLGAEASVAVDSAGTVLAAYEKNLANGAPKLLYTTTSRDGLHWSTPAIVNDQGDSNKVEVVSGPSAGDFRLAWQDNRYNPCWTCGWAGGGWNTWYERATDGAISWSPAARLSNLNSGASYKNSMGYTSLFGDYFGLATNSAGTVFAIWGEADNISTYCCGGSWYTSGA